MKISTNILGYGINVAHRKEDKFFKSYTLISFNQKEVKSFNNGFSENLSVRFYNTNSTSYCCIWGSLKGVHFNGSGKASGYGYDRLSAAFEYALKSAGFNVSGLAATGQNEEAIKHLSKLMGLKKFTIVHAHA